MACSVVATAVTSRDLSSSDTSGGGGDAARTVIGGGGEYGVVCSTTGSAGVTVAGNNRIAINVHYGSSAGTRGDTPLSRGDSGTASDAVTASSSSSSSSSGGTSGSTDDGVVLTSTLPSNSPLSQQDNQCELYTNGPDQLIPSDSLYTSQRDGAVKLRMGTSGVAASTPVSVQTHLDTAAQRYGNSPALRYKTAPDGEWQTLTYTDYVQQIRCVARAFISLGLPRHGVVCILGFNSPEWFVSCLAAMYAGGAAAGIYTTNSAEACRHCAVDCQCCVFVVENEKQLAKILPLRDQIPSLRAIVQYSGTVQEPGVLSWQQLVDLGAESDSQQLRQRVKQTAVNQVAAIIYTSGTTGLPKGVMLSHDNLTYVARMSQVTYKFHEASEHVVSYLPLSHVAALTADLFMTTYVGACAWFAGADALKGGLVKTLLEARPTVFLGVPRVFEKIREGFELKSRQAKGLRRNLLDWALSCGRRAQQGRINGSGEKPFGYSLARRLVLSKIHKALGLDRCRFMSSGAAPCSAETIDFFHSVDMPLLQVYGMSESTGPHLSTVLECDDIGSVGPPTAGVQVRIDRPNLHSSGQHDRHGEGEVCLSGRNVFMGYLSRPELTAETIDADGWLHSGDLGVLNARGMLTISGRSKELIITAGGENIPPVLIEAEVRRQLPLISQCCLIGDRRKFLSILLTLKVDIDMDTLQPTDKLSPTALEFCSEIGSKSITVTDILSKPDDKVMTAIQAGIDRVNKTATSNAQRIQKWTILPVDFSAPGGEIGPTMKLKRNFVLQKYADVIERFYS